MEASRGKHPFAIEGSSALSSREISPFQTQSLRGTIPGKGLSNERPAGKMAKNEPSTAFIAPVDCTLQGLQLFLKNSGRNSPLKTLFSPKPGNRFPRFFN